MESLRSGRFQREEGGSRREDREREGREARGEKRKLSKRKSEIEKRRWGRGERR